ncbi:MAG: hypothetical protein AB7T63_02420 [Planctomycetota bacterium]
MSSLSALTLIYDIRGFTAASRRVGAHDLGTYATAAHRIVLDCFADRPPTFVKNLGDGHLLIWEVHGELDPALAEAVVAAAGRARTAFAAWATRQREAGADLPTRVGIGVAFGEVHRSDDYYGRAINVASRLQHLARPEGLALDASVHAAVRRQENELEAAFTKMKAKLKGLGSTWVFVQRPFSWARLFGRVGRVAAVVALPLGWVALADAGIALPGGAAIRDAIDERDWSVLRPAPTVEEIQAAVPALRTRLCEALLGLATEDGLLRNAFDAPDADTSDVWSSCQALTALFRAPELGSAHAERLRAALEVPFADRHFIEVDGTAFGWLAHAGMAYTEIEPALWTVSALALALARPGFLEGAARERALAHLDRAQRAADLYRPMDTGGWNIFPQQDDLLRHSPYSTTMAVLALLELRAAGLGWHGADAERDRLLGQSVRFLARHFETDRQPPGWRRTNDPSDKISAGLSMQILALLLRAEREAGLALSDAIEAAIPDLLLRLEDASLEDAYDMGEFAVSFTNHEGRKDSRTEGINFLWHPWAVETAWRWLERAEAKGASRRDQVRVRRALGRWILERGDEAVRAATTGYCFVASETLYGLSAVR